MSSAGEYRSSTKPDLIDLNAHANPAGGALDLRDEEPAFELPVRLFDRAAAEQRVFAAA